MESRFNAMAMDDAVNRAALSEVIELLDRGVDPNIRDVVGDTPLISAAWIGAPEIVELLLHRGADVHAKGDGGKTALQRLRASAGYRHEGHVRVMELLIAAGAKT